MRLSSSSAAGLGPSSTALMLRIRASSAIFVSTRRRRRNLPSTRPYTSAAAAASPSSSDGKASSEAAPSSRPPTTTAPGASPSPEPSAAPRRKRFGAKFVPDTRPPKPKPDAFYRDDVLRIKERGASGRDVTATRLVPVREEAPPRASASADGGKAPGGGGSLSGKDLAGAFNVVEAEYKWVPVSVTGDAFVGEEPAWDSLEEMSATELLSGLRRRNWTDPESYDPDNAVPWRVEIFKDVGRQGAPAWTGYRVLVTEASDAGGGPRTRWVDLPTRGVCSQFAFDHVAGGGPGGYHRGKRSSPGPPGRPSEVGYAAVFEQLFQAFEQRLSADSLAQLASEGWVERSAETYDCPGDRLLLVSHGLIPARPAPLRVAADVLPVALAVLFSFGFLGTALALGIFRKKKGMPTDIQEAVEFAQSKGRARREGTTGVAFSDVAGQDKLLGDLAFVVEFLKDPSAYARLGAAPPKGILLEGGPGTGKTLIAKAIAGEAGVPFYAMSGAEFVEAIVGVGAARVRDLFKRARVQNGPCIIFIDEVDAIGAKRAAGDRRPNEEREQTLNQLLSELDGFTPGQGVVFVAATNRADLLDAALLRPGRFDRRVTIGLPDARGRLGVLRVHAGKKLVGDDVDLEQLALDTPGLSGAELANVVNEAALAAARRGAASVEQRDFDSSLDRILYGLVRPSLPDRLGTKRHFACYEAGVGVLCEVLRSREREERERGRRRRRKGTPPSSSSSSSSAQDHPSIFADDSESLPLSVEAVERLSITPRGDSWSRSILARRGDAASFVVTRARVAARLQVLLAGHAAEALLCGSEGASSYAAMNGALEAAHQLADKAIGEYAFFGSSVAATTVDGVDGGVGGGSPGSSPEGPKPKKRLPVFRPSVYAPRAPTGPASLVTSKYRVAVVNLDTDAFGGAPPRGAAFQPPDLRRDAQRVDVWRLVRAAHAAATRALEAHRGAVEEVVEMLMEKGDVSGAEVRSAIEKDSKRKEQGGDPSSAVAAGVFDEDADLEAIFRKFAYQEGSALDDEDDWTGGQREDDGGVASRWPPPALPASEKLEPVRPSSTSPEARAKEKMVGAIVGEGDGDGGSKGRTALQVALADPSEDANSYEDEDEGGGESGVKVASDASASSSLWVSKAEARVAALAAGIYEDDDGEDEGGENGEASTTAVSTSTNEN